MVIFLWGVPMKKTIKSLFMLLVLSLFIGASGGCVTAETTVTYTTHSRTDFINETVIANSFSGDDRIDDYQHETFDDPYTYIGGISEGWAYDTNYTTDETESFGGSAIYINVEDGHSFNINNAEYNIVHLNSTDGDVQAFELDFMFEDNSYTGYLCTQWFGYEFAGNPATCVNITSSNTTVFTKLPNPDLGASLGYQLEAGKWHHMIQSVKNNIVDGLEVTIIIDNVSVVMNAPKKAGLALDTFKIGWMPGFSGTSVTGGRDIILDNLILYNGSFNDTELIGALSTVHTLAIVGEITGIFLAFIPVMIIVGIIPMMTGITKKNGKKY
jgi:hypothetical protein